MKKQLLLILMTLLPTLAWADESGTCGDNLTWTYYESTHSLTISGIGNMNNYSGYYNVYSDWVDGSPWFSLKEKIENIIMESGITSIGNYSFYGCKNLTSVTIPNSVTSIGEYAFSYCRSLTSVTIGNSVTSIGVCAFDGCSSLTSVTIPNSVKTIERQAFMGCSSLTSVTIGNSVTSIGEYAFSGCYRVSSIYISDLSAWCRIKNGSSTNAIIPSNHHLYLNGVDIEQLIIPSDITSLDNYTFYGCNYLTSIIIPNNVTSIGECAFGNCI